MVVKITSSGPMSVGTPFQQSGGSTRIRSSGGSSGGRIEDRVSTPETPTPSAGELFGSASDREAQLSAFRSGGQSAFETERAAAQERSEVEAQRQSVAVPFDDKGGFQIQEQTKTGFLEDIRQSEVQPVQPTERSFSTLGGVGTDIQRRQDVLRARTSRGDEGLFLGPERFALGFAGAAIGFGTSIINPIATFKGFGKAILSPIQTGKGIKQELVTGFKTDPSGTFGALAFDVALFKGPGVAKTGVIKGTDIIRTRGLTKLATEDIIAPEFFAGQTFPKIRKGQTAGQLLEEFKPLLPGETKGAGFTAAPKPFKSETVIERGTSEFPGLFQAPKVSPRFLRVSAEEEKLFTLDFFGDTLRPTTARVTPTEFELVPGIRSTQKSPQPQKQPQIKQFFEEAPKGKSFVPFTKTEKEAIIPFGTPLKETQRRFFFEFEGRKIPIIEFETGLGKGVTGLPTAKEVGTSLSRSRVGSRGKVSPFDIVSSPVKLRSRVRTSLVSSSFALTPSGGGRISRGRRGLDSGSFLPRPSTGRGFFPGISRGGGVSRGDFNLGREPPLLPPPEFPGIPGKKKRGIFRGDTEDAFKLKTPIFQERTFQRTPSFGAVVKFQLGFKQKKFSEKLERTGLLERAFQGPQLIKPLGPFELR